MPDSTRGRAMTPVSLRIRAMPNRAPDGTGAGARVRGRSVRQDEHVQAPWDLLVVGAGPAGSTAALAALRADPTARVALLDAASFPRDKCCGDGIAPHCLDELRDLGVVGVERGFAP